MNRITVLMSAETRAATLSALHLRREQLTGEIDRLQYLLRDPGAVAQVQATQREIDLLREAAAELWQDGQAS